MRRAAPAGVVAALTLALGSPAGAQPTPPGPEAHTEALSVSPASVRAGESIQVAGRGCRQGEPVELSIFRPGEEPMGTLLAGRAGIFGASVRLPEDTQPGRAWVRATCTGADGRPWVMDATLSVSPAPIRITPVNVLFGLGAALAVAGFGLLVRRRPARGSARRRRAEAPSRPRGRRRRSRRQPARPARRGFLARRRRRERRRAGVAG